MNEMLMVTGKKGGGLPPGTKPVAGYNFDKNTSTGTTKIAIGSMAGALQALPAPLAGYTTQALKLDSGAFAITPATPLDVGGGDFTVEFAFYPYQTADGYSTMFFQDNATGSGVGLVVRIANSGYGSRLQVSLNAAAANGSANFSTPFTRAMLVNKWNHIAVQRASGKIQVYVNGVKQGLAIAVSSDYSVKDQPSGQSLSGTKTLRLGHPSFPGNAWIPEFAIYLGVKYVKDFTPSYPLVS